MFTRIILLFIFAISTSPGEEWYPFSISWDNSPVDISYLLDPPAGKHGFLGVKKDRFVFEDGTTIRFWGTMLSGSACFPPKDEAGKIARNFARNGINLVRFQNLDAPWSRPNLFLSNTSNELEIDPGTMDRLDYFLIQLKQRGIYAYFDGLDALNVNDMTGYGQIPPGFGPYIHFVPQLQSIYENFLYQFWTHRNRYSMPSVQYRDDPMIVMTQILSKHSLSKPFSIRPPYQEDVFIDWENWSKTQNIVEKLTPETPQKYLKPFYTFIMARTHGEIRKFLRTNSVKSVIAGSGKIHELMDLFAQQAHDISIQEGYYNQTSAPFPQYANKKLLDATMAQDTHLLKRLAFANIKGKPYLINEWRNPWPNEFRAELPIWLAAKACEQEWNGLISSPYRVSHENESKAFLKPIYIGNDPCLIGLFPAAALLFHQNDIPHRRKIELALSESLLHQEETISPESVQTTKLVHHYQVHSNLNREPSGSRVLAPTQPDIIQQYFKDYDRHSTFFHDEKRGIVIINTAKTQAVIGDLRKIKETDLDDVKIQSDEPFAVLSVNSLDDKSISRSEKMLITLVSKAQNQGFRSDAFMNGFRVLQMGTPPVLIKSTPARLFLELQEESWKIEALASDGEVLETIPYQKQNENLSFRAGIHGTIYYRMTKD